VQREFQPTVYHLANRNNGAIYTGVASNLLQRIHQHGEALMTLIVRGLRDGS
jgi:putative endonuclease